MAVLNAGDVVSFEYDHLYTSIEMRFIIKLTNSLYFVWDIVNGDVTNVDVISNDLWSNESWRGWKRLT